MQNSNLLLLSIKDFFTPTMLKYSLMPFIATAIIMYILFIILAGAGLDQLGNMEMQSTQTTMQNGVPHTVSTSTILEGIPILQSLIGLSAVSWIASFFVYLIGGFVVLYLSIFVAIIIIGFLTPAILLIIKQRHYKDVEIVGFGSTLSSLLNVVKWAFIMLALLFLFIPFYFIPIINIIALNFPLYYFFHKMINFDIASNLTTKEEYLEIKYRDKTSLRVKTLSLYLISLIPFMIFFTAIFYVIYMGHTYFSLVSVKRTAKLDG